jgi:alpha-tubulin suppressor-like RCC1 family protein
VLTRYIFAPFAKSVDQRQRRKQNRGIVVAAVLSSLALVSSVACNDDPTAGQSSESDPDIEPDGTSSSETTSQSSDTSLATSSGTTSSDGTSSGDTEIKVVAISAAQSTSCAFLSNNRAKCWGGNRYGQLGRGSTSSVGAQPGQMGSALPYLDLPPDISPQSILAGTSVCITDETARPFCWGLNDFGQLGRGNTDNYGDDPSELLSKLRNVPLHPGLEVAEVEIGLRHGCAVFAPNAEGVGLKCWGLNYDGQLGQGNTNNIGSAPNQMGEFLAPVDLGKDRHPVRVAVGLDHTCVATNDEKVLCWGKNANGQLGIGSTKSIGSKPEDMGNNLVPVKLGDQPIAALATGSNHTCSLDVVGKVRCWGQNDLGQLGRGDKLDFGGNSNEAATDIPPISLPAKVSDLSCGTTHCCSLLEDHRVVCWGSNALGELGVGTKAAVGDDPNEMGTKMVAVELGSNRTPIAVHAGSSHNCVLTSASEVLCWGYNGNGQLGSGNSETVGDGPDELGSRLLPVPIL